MEILTDFNLTKSRFQGPAHKVDLAVIWIDLHESSLDDFHSRGAYKQQLAIHLHTTQYLKLN